jgi:hypothetical protein
MWSIALIVFGRRSEHVRTWAAFAKVERLLAWLAASAGAAVMGLIAQELRAWFAQRP